MRNNQIEYWALDIIERVESGQPIEDTRVELKTKWPSDEKRAARQIAGHANAAHGEPFLWLIGVNEKARTVPGVEAVEFSNWYSSVKSAFSELAPEVTNLNVPVPDGTVVALLFQADRAPYLVNNPDGGKIHREVPWREGNSTQTATRSQLIRLLSPLEQLPDIEAVSATLDVQTSEDSDRRHHLDWNARIRLFLAASGNRETVIPDHRCHVTIRPYDLEPIEPLEKVAFHSSGPANVDATEDAVAVTGNGVFGIGCGISVMNPWGPEALLPNDLLNNDAHLEVELRFVNTARPISLDICLEPGRILTHYKGTWSFTHPGFAPKIGGLR